MQMFSLEAGGIQMMQLEDAELAGISSSLLVLPMKKDAMSPTST